MNRKLSKSKLVAILSLCCLLILSIMSFCYTAFAAENVESITIDIDYGLYFKKELPNGMVGKSYPVFDCSAVDNLGNNVSDIQVIVKNPEGKVLALKDDRFNTETKGDYTIEYIATSGIVSKTESVKITVIAYSDTLIYDNSSENVTGSANTGDVVLAYFGKFSGGVGNLEYSFSLKLADENVAFDETENGICFTPEKSGTYVLVYKVTDFVGSEKNITKNVVVSDSDVPVMQKPSVPAMAVSGETIDLPLVDSVLYKNGKKYYLPVKVSFDGTDITETLQVNNLEVGNHTIKYESVNPLDSTKKTEYSAELTVKKSEVEKTARLYDNYFIFENCSPKTGDNKDYQVEIAKDTAKASFAFSRKIPVEYIGIELSTEKPTYSKLYIKITDSKKADDSIKVRIESLAKYESFGISFDSDTNTIVNSDDGTVVAEIKSYEDGRVFNGFNSGNVYISAEVEDVKNDTIIAIKKVASNVITTDSEDYVAPVFKSNNDFRYAYVSYVGHTIYLPKMEVFDLLEDDIKVTLSVYANDATLYEGSEAYTLTVEEGAEYIIQYVAKDSNGNRKTLTPEVTVVDIVSPTINVSKIKSTVKVGDSITLPTAEISDNDTASEEIISYCYVYYGNYQKKLLDDTYKFETAGEYKIRYVAFDNSQNYTVVEFTVVCK